MTSITRRIAGQFAWASSSRVVAALLQALLTILAARSVAPAEFGLLAAMLGITTLLQVVFDMGVQTFTTRERAAHGDVGSVASAIRFNGRTSLALAIAGAGIIAVAGFVNTVFLYMLPLAIWISAERTADVRLTVAFADGDVKVTGINLMGRRALAIASFLVIIQTGLEPILAYTSAVALAAICSAFFAVNYIKRRVKAAPTLSFRELLNASWPYWLNSVANQSRNLDSAITAALAGATQASMFAIASRITSPLRILPTTLASVLLPNAARAGSDRSAITVIMRLALLALAATTGLYAIIALAAPWFVPILLGDEYLQSIPALQIVVAGLPFAAVTSLLSSMLQGGGHKHFIAATSTLTGVFCLALVALGAIWFGAVGAAAALSITYFGQAVVVGVGFYKRVWSTSG